MSVKLDEYNRKRNFDKTLEPEGETGIAEKQLRFAMQHHIARRDHYDLRLEWEGVLLSWAVPKGPSYDPRDKRLAVQVEEHPLEYRNFEGTIPKGEYGGGVVMLWDEGTWEPQSDVYEGLGSGALKFVLKGRRLKGKWALIRLKPKVGETGDNWLLLKEKDAYAQADSGVSGFDTSIRTGRTMTEIEEGKDEKYKKNPFGKTDVQLAKLVTTVPEGNDWLYELKFDGYRIVTFAQGNDVRLITRGGNDYSKRFQNVARSITEWADGRAMVLDGEMVVTDVNGRTDFQALQNYIKNPNGKNLSYIVFDLLAFDGEDWRGRPLIERKQKLEALMLDAPENLCFSQYIRGNGEESFSAACQANLEGVVGKRANSVYSGTRNGDWIKLKCEKRQEFIIGGYMRTDKKTSGISALLLGIYEGEELVYSGRAGTGFTERDMKELETKFESIKREATPFKQAPKLRKNEKITWLEPLLVAEIKFAEWTGDNQLRQASFKGLREDRKPGDIKMEKADGDVQTMESEKRDKQDKKTEESDRPKRDGSSAIVDGVKITNPDKVIFDDPEITKLDVVRYYAVVSARMLPYVQGRILSIVRCPKGVTQSCFYKKHPGPDSKGIVTMPTPTSSGKTEDYFYINNAAGLIYEAQMGTIEFHTWGSSVEALEKPDIMVFDLDPDEGMHLDTVRQGVTNIKSVLDNLELSAFLKTSGGKGYHIVVPFKASVGWDMFHDFARRVAEVMEQQWPDRYTSNVRKNKRTNKIFIDWIRNGRGATSIAPYSLRARSGARVSMPITWQELNTVAPNQITLADALERISGSDPWRDFFQIEQQLK